MLLVQGRGEMAVLPAVTAYCYIILLWIHALTAVLIVQGRGEMAVLPAVTAVLLHPSITIQAVVYITISFSTFPLIQN